MKRSRSWTAWVVLAVAVLAWCGYGYEIVLLSNGRAAYAVALDEKQQDDVKGEAALKLHTLIESSKGQRDSVAALVQRSILDAVTTIENAGKTAGTKNVSIGEATPVAAVSKGTAAYDIIVVAEGTFAEVTRAEALFERLPLASSLQQFGLEHLGSSWHLTARIRVYLNAQ